MAELTPFSYHAGRSLLHGLDARFKLAFLILISLSSLKSQLFALCLFAPALCLLMFHIRISFASVIREIRYFLILLVFVFAARALSVPGSPILEIRFPLSLTVTGQGLYEGTLVCCRLVLIVLTSLLLVSTTRPSEIRSAVGWFLNPFPFVPGKRIATMIGLTIRFIPVILNQARETADAQRARGIENRKNPVYRLIRLIIPLMRRTFENADHLVIAMEARCYTEKRTDPALSSGKKEWLATLVVIAFCILMLEM